MKNFFMFIVFCLFGICLFSTCKQTHSEWEQIEVTFTEKTRKAGDVLLSIPSENKTEWLSLEELLKKDYKLEGKNPIGVLAFEKNGVPYCIGLGVAKDKAWAIAGKDGADGNARNITGLQGEINSGNTAQGLLESEVADFGETKYPAFAWAKNFDANGVKYKNTETKGTWQLPTITELRKVYTSRTAINESLKKLYSLTKYKSDDESPSSWSPIETLGNDWYWSCTQSVSVNNCAWNQLFAENRYYEIEKERSNGSVLVVRAFEY